MKRLPVIALLSVCMLCACQKEGFDEAFLQSDALRLEIKGYTVFSYDPLSCQMGFSRDKAEFRVHSDNMSDFYILALSRIPAGVGEEIPGSITWTTSKDIHNKKTTFEVMKLEGGRIWLWSSSNRTAVVVGVLD